MEKRVVLPGEKIADGRAKIPHTFFDGEATYAEVIGTLDEEGRYIALESAYRPSVGDTIIGIVTNIRRAGYLVDLNLPQEGLIVGRDVKVKLQRGDIVMCRVKMVTEVGDTELGEVRRLPRGKVVDFPPSKTPRLIGRKSSMLNLLREHAEGDVMVGNNGYVWISEKSNIPLVLKAISLVKQKAHRSGLTDEMAEMLKKETQG
ncbi:hypothetical protein GF318_01385 [Candidatus Micrarchaeota archaeon]|nr:hypothetical protein [Candidatus Micrarchaeota archaeon]